MTSHITAKPKFKLFNAKLNTKGKTPEQILSDYAGPKPSDNEVQSWIKAYNSISGIEVVVMESWLGEGYTLAMWNPENDELIRDFIYQAEQDPYFGSYINAREEFIKDWESNDYSPSASLSFNKEDVEIIGELKRKGEA